MINLLVAPIANPVLPWTINKGTDQGAPILGKFFGNFVGILLVIGAIWAFANLLLGGIAWISSAGDKAKLEAAQQRILNAIIGLFIVFAAWAIFFVLLKFLGLTKSTGGALQLNLPTFF